MVSWILALGLAMGQEADSSEVDDEIIIYGEMLVEQARQEVIKGFRKEGYTLEKDKGDFVRLRHTEAWRGEVRIYDDGWMKIKRQPFQIEGREVPWADRNSPLAWASCLLLPPNCLKAGGILVGRRKFMSQKVRALASLEPEIRVWSDRVADQATEKTVEGLSSRLEQLWLEGVALSEGGGVIEAPEDRRKALLDYWESRTDTIWGDRVRAGIEVFIRGEIQYSEHPYTAEEIAAFNERRTCRRAFDLERPYADLVADLRRRSK